MRALERLVRLLALWGAVVSATAAAQHDESAEAPMRELQAYDQRLATISYRLALSARDLCANQVPLTGIEIHDLAQYRAKDQSSAIRVFGFDGFPKILAVAARSPAADAGIRSGDSVVAIGGKPVGTADSRASFSSRRVAALARTLDESARGNPLALVIGRGEHEQSVRINLQRGCATRFQSGTSTALDAVADGNAVEVDLGTMRFASDDDQLAAVTAHELAHNILRHLDRLAAARVRNSRGGRNQRLIRLTEDEADRLSVYLLDRAGYPPDAAITFWTRMGARQGEGTLRLHGHGNPAERIALLKSEIDRLAAMKQAGQAPKPAFMMSSSLPALK
jgi:uncharacterized small protein (DUF1192 family)